MKRHFYFLIFYFVGQFAFGQSPGDTIVIETFNYSQTYGVNQWSPGIRDTMIDFSTLPNVSFEKVIMSYNMRCKGGNVSTGANRDFGCGEWDISCNTYIHDPSRIDSVKNLHPNYTVSGFSGDSFPYTSLPTYDFYQYTQDPGSLDSIISETQFTIGTGLQPTSDVLDGTNNSGKSQFLIKASELTASGLTAGDINGFLVNALDSGMVSFLRINIKSTTEDSLTENLPHSLDFTEVYFSNYEFEIGDNRIQFNSPYNWNGTDNLILEMSFTNSEMASNISLQGSSSENNSMVANNNYNVNLAANTHIEVPSSALAVIDNQITVSFWAKGDPGLLPAKTSIVHATNSNNQRELNIHLPWENSRIYFDCGNPGTGYDRIEKQANDSEIEGQWHHWAATKNSTSGEMKLFLNGELWQSGTGKTKPMEIVEFIIGKSNSLTNNYQGQIDQVRIWDTALTESTIKDWMNRKVNVNHPNYSNLLVNLEMDEGIGIKTFNSIQADSSTISNQGTWKFERGIDISRDFKFSANRPNFTFLRGTYNFTSNPITVLDSIVKTPNTISTFSINSFPSSLNDDEVITTSQTTVWHATDQVIYDGQTNAIISTLSTPVQNTTLPSVDLEYYKRYAAKIEIMSFVTPYGIGLDLGPNGKTWTFDMTDYLPIFNGNKRMTIERGGQWMEDMDIRFLFIVGTPTRDVLDFQQIWRPEARSYTSILSDQFFPAKDVPLIANGKSFKVRTAISGHGQQGEFTPRDHYVNINNSQQFDWTVWKECGDNPIYPQGGTWVYDRAGWCPGAATDVEHMDITPFVTAGQTANIDYGISTATGDSRYIVNSQLVTYGDINHTLDAAVYEIQEPSNRVEFTRFNSICHDPKITIQNTGSTTLTSLTIKYWVNNASTPQTFNWTGSLEFLETETITVPSNGDLWGDIQPSANKFNVTIENPNGGTDQYSHNNTLSSNFEIPDVLPLDFVVAFSTNNAGQESSYEIIDNQNNVVYSRSNMQSNTQYKDTIHLNHGCYSFNVYDSDDDGVSWWANQDGSGSIRLRKYGANGVLKAFNGDFGDNIHYNFTTVNPLDVDKWDPNQRIELYPNPTSDLTNIIIKDFDKDITLKVINLQGQIIMNKNIESDNGFYKGSIDLTKYPTGLYFVQITDGNSQEQIKLIKE